MKGAFERRLEIFFVYLLPVIVVCSKTLSRGTPAYLSPNAPKINFRDQYKNLPCTKHRSSVTGDYLFCTNSTTSATYCIYKVSPEITFLAQILLHLQRIASTKCHRRLPFFSRGILFHLQSAPDPILSPAFSS